MTGRFNVRTTAIAGLVVVERKGIGDERGWLERTFSVEEFQALGVERSIRQINRTLTRTRGTVRGLHFQRPPHAEFKIVSCTRGRVLDIAVDLRAGSATFLSWHGEVLSGDNRMSLVIPEGFAHGFQTLEYDTEMLYLHTADYAPDAEGGLDALDPRLGIPWPLAVAQRSGRDMKLPPVQGDWEGIRL